MNQVNIHEIKANFAKYLGKVAQGETLIICKHNKPFVQMSPLQKPKPVKRILGSGKGSLKVSPDCFEPWPKDYLDFFYAEGKSGKDDPLFWKP
jgi:antitoxin (DNA-binding transcriptional repressor) of toxin-antitoxin stability system